MEVETERHYQMMGRMGHCLRDDLAAQADAIRRAAAGPDQQNSEAVRTGSDVPPPLAPMIGSGMDQATYSSSSTVHCERFKGGSVNGGRARRPTFHPR
jgi:hypothetical protein